MLKARIIPDIWRFPQASITSLRRKTRSFFASWHNLAWPHSPLASDNTLPTRKNGQNAVLKNLSSCPLTFSLVTRAEWCLPVLVVVRPFARPSAFDRRKHNIQKNKTPCFIVFFALLCLEACLFAQKGQQTKGKQKSKFSCFFFPERSFLQKEAFGFRVVVVFCGFFFFAWIRGEILKGSSGSTKRPDSCSNWFSRVWNFDQNCASYLTS